MRTAPRTTATVTGDPRTGDHGGARPPLRSSAVEVPESTAADTGDPRTGVRGGALLRHLLQAGPWLAVGLVLVFIASMAGVLPWQVMRVDSDSMLPTVDTGDLLVVTRGSGPVERGTVVAVEDPSDAEGMLVKRVAGVGGDVIAIEDGILIVNGETVCEPAIDPDLIDGVFHGPVTVPAGSLFLLSDNRDRSLDSRSFGPVPADSMVGTVSLRLWPSPGALPDPTEGC